MGIVRKIKDGARWIENVPNRLDAAADRHIESVVARAGLDADKSFPSNDSSAPEATK